MSQEIIKGLQAQFDAAKQMHNETLNQNLLLRANQILLQNQIQDLINNLQLKDKEIAELKGDKNASDKKPE